MRGLDLDRNSKPLSAEPLVVQENIRGLNRGVKNKHLWKPASNYFA